MGVGELYEVYVILMYTEIVKNCAELQGLRRSKGVLAYGPLHGNLPSVVGGLLPIFILCCPNLKSNFRECC